MLGTDQPAIEAGAEEDDEGRVREDGPGEEDEKGIGSEEEEEGRDGEEGEGIPESGDGLANKGLCSKSYRFMFKSI